MGSICLSSASILRCDSLTRHQNIFLIIPTALEVIFSISLVFIDRGPRKRNLLLTAEGLFFLILAVLELLSQIVPAVRGNLRLFKGFDLAIGIASFLPISLYTIFLYLLTSTDIVSAVPRRIRKVARLALILFIPAIIVFNEIASFIGVSIRNRSTGNIPTGGAPQTAIVVGFSGSTQQGLWTFFTSLTLALLAGFQVAAFCFAFFRLTQAILDQRRIESERRDKEHLIKGTGWITASLKLGVLETVVGFAGGEFGVVLSRRILRLLARATLCIGVAKGVDLVEDSRAIRNEPVVTGGAKFRRSQIHKFISSPRFSTFRQLSPKATAFHAVQQASVIHEQSATYNTLTNAGLPGMAHFANVKAQNGRQRVTIRYDRGAPLLDVRFSMLDIPTMVEENKARPHPEWDAHLPQPQPSFRQPLKSMFRDSADSIPSFCGPFELVTAPRRMLSQRSARAQLYQAASPATSGESLYLDSTNAVEPQHTGRVLSVKSIPDSLEAVRDLAGQFPGPPMAFKDQIWQEVAIEIPLMPQALGSPSELRFKEQPPYQGNMGDSASSSIFSSPDSFSDNGNARSSRQPTLYTVTGTPLKSAPPYSEKPMDLFNDDDEEDAHSPSRPVIASKNTLGATVPMFRQVNSLQGPEKGTGDVLEATLDTHISRPRKLPSSQQESLHKIDEMVAGTAEWIGSRSRATSRLPQAEPPTNLLLQQSHESDVSIDHLAIPSHIEEDRGVVKAVSQRDIPLHRVKGAAGKAPRKKLTPLSMQANPNRGSMHLKPIIIPSRGENMLEIVNEYEQSAVTGGGILRDSEVEGRH